jgi:hypothetical protein
MTTEPVGFNDVRTIVFVLTLFGVSLFERIRRRKEGCQS